MKNAILLLTSLFFATIVASSQNFQYGSEGQSTTLANFSAIHKGNAVQISWTALNEINVAVHEVEKSANGSSFTNIGTIMAQNNAAPYNYTFLDATPGQGINYYRLRTTDKKGNVTFSNILQVNNGFARTEVRVLGNPVQGGVLNLQMNNINGGQYVISLYSSSGQKVFARSLNFTDGSVTETINLPGNLGRGLYFLQFTDGETRINREIMLQ